MYKYRVLEKCFIGNVLRTPGGRHDPYVTDTKLTPCPSYLELEERERPPRKPRKVEPQPDVVQGKVAGEDLDFEM